MKAFGVFLTLCITLTLSPAVPLNSTALQGLCHYQRQNCSTPPPMSISIPYCPQCDANGNFRMLQCSLNRMDRRCWCVNVITGQMIPNTSTYLGAPANYCETKLYCPNGWVWFEERCYTFINTPKKWIEAEIYCQFDGANLASVHSEEENHFVTYLAREEADFLQTWLGGFDAIQPGHWIWSDGSKFNYENWYNQSYGNHNNDSYLYDDDSRHHDRNYDDDDDSRHHDRHYDDDDDSRHHDRNYDDDDDSRHHDRNYDDDDDSRHHDSHHDDDDDSRHHDSRHDDDDDSRHHDSHHDDDDDHEEENRNCLRMNYESDLKWFYTSCTESLPFVCSKKADAHM